MILTSAAAGPGPHETGPRTIAAANACSNPVLATNLNGWGSLDGSWTSRDPVGDLPGVAWAFDTGGRRFYMPQLSVTPGQQWIFAAMSRVVYASGTAKIVAEWYNASGQFIGQQTGPLATLPASTPTGGQWTPVAATVTVPAGAAFAHVLQIGDFGSATGTNFKATQCVYELASNEAAVRHGWGSLEPSESDEYNGTSVDLAKWGLFGAGPGQTTGCSPGYQGHGQRCASQTAVGGGYLSVTGTANGVTGGLWSNHGGFRYGRVEVRERAVALSPAGAPYHVVPLLMPSAPYNYTQGEIDFAERDVATSMVKLFVHHDNTQNECAKTIDSTQFHNYAIDWQPSSVKWYVDGELVCTVNASVSTFSNSNGGAQMDMFPPSGPMQPARIDVDWIRMYPIQATQYN